MINFFTIEQVIESGCHNLKRLVNRSGNHCVMIYMVNRSQNQDIMIYRDAVNRSLNADVMIYMVNRSRNQDDMIYKVNSSRIPMS